MHICGCLGRPVQLAVTQQSLGLTRGVDQIIAILSVTAIALVRRCGSSSDGGFAVSQHKGDLCGLPLKFEGVLAVSTQGELLHLIDGHAALCHGVVRIARNVLSVRIRRIDNGHRRGGVILTRRVDLEGVR